MKILTINTKFSGGGAAKIAYSIHNDINNTEENEGLFLAGYGNKKDEQCIKITKDKFKYISALSFRLTAKECNFTSNIEKYIKNADIIHIHNLHGYYIDYEKVIELIVKYDKPLVWTLHDIWAFTGRCAIATSCDKWKKGCGSCTNKNLYPKSKVDNSASEYLNKKNIFKKLDKNKTIIVTPSKWLKELAKESIIKDFKIVNIANGIKININNKYDKKYLRRKYSIPEDKNVVLFIAANPNDDLKGIKLLFKSMEELKDTIFISIGSKIQVEYPNLIQLGYINSNEKINEVYKLSDIYVNPSLSENFPTTNLEAFANKVPVIGFSIGGIVEQLESKCGILVDFIDENKLLDEIRKLLGDKCLQKEISENAFNKYMNKYNYEKFITEYNEVYRELIK